MNVIIVCSAVMAVFAVFLSYFASIPNNQALYRFLTDSGLCGITILNGSTARVVLHTATRFFLVAYLGTLYRFYKTDSLGERILSVALMAVFIIAIFVSYTRAVYVGCVIAVLAATVTLIIKQDRKLINVICALLTSVAVAVLALVLMGATQRSNLFVAALNRVQISVDYVPEDPTSGSIDATIPTEDTSGDQSETESLNQRQYILKLLNESIQNNPIFGNGLGAAIDYRDGYVEYSYHDIINKMGILGLILFVLPFILEAATLGRSLYKRKYASFGSILAVSAMCYFLFIAYFNPSLNTTLGISCYLFSIAIVDGNKLDSDQNV